MRLLVLGKIRITQILGLYDLPNANFGLFISNCIQCSNEINRPEIALAKCLACAIF